MGLLLRRFTRWTLTVLLALVLSLEIASVWWTFHWQRGQIFDANQVRITVERGEWEIYWHQVAQSDWLGSPTSMIPRGFSVRHADDIGWGFRTGLPPPFTWTACDFTPPRYGWSWGTLSFPLAWAILALALPTGWLWLGDFRRRKKARAGCCRTCGYDLRGLEQANTQDQPHQPTRCPECGESPAPPGS